VAGEDLIELVLLAVLGGAFFMGWGMGANDAANSMATSVGARILTMRRAILILIIFAMAGAVLQGGYVTRTIGKDIVFFENEHAVPVENMGLSQNVTPTPFMMFPLAALATILTAAIGVTVATRFGLPVSASHSIVGAVMGAGFALVFVNPPAVAGAGVQIGFNRLTHIALSWIITPFAAITFAFLIYHIFNRLMRPVKNIAQLNTIYRILVIMTACFMAYSFGANNVGNAAGVVVAINPGFDKQLLGLFVGVAIACGAILYSQRVIDTVGKRITVLMPSTAFAAQFGAALTVYIFTLLAMPVSTSHAVVGGVIGAGLVRGVSAVSGRKIGWITLAGVSTPFITMAMSFGLAVLLMGV
jgi:PiT family inorganic phosphate transporter